ncbi:MAG TPA: hypothetical protein VMU51_18220 [Mycobacteriales bacterium]|nr:hypothetical protein [Mycobacteriales bacterium]
MTHPMGPSLLAELEYRRARLVRTGRSVPVGSRGTRRAERAEHLLAERSRTDNRRNAPATAYTRAA